MLCVFGDDGFCEFVDFYVEVWECGDVEAVVEMLIEDVVFMMLLLKIWFGGCEEIVIFLVCWLMFGTWCWKLLLVSANGQPAFVFYVWDDDEVVYIFFAFNVFILCGNKISEVDVFIMCELVDFDLEMIV